MTPAGKQAFSCHSSDLAKEEAALHISVYTMCMACCSAHSGWQVLGSAEDAL